MKPRRRCTGERAAIVCPLVAERELNTLLEGGSFFEGPRWHEGRWWVSDFYRHLVLTVDSGGRAEEVIEVEQQPSGLGWMPDGSMLVVSMKDHRLLRRSPDGEVTEHADLTEHCGGHLTTWSSIGMAAPTWATSASI